MSANDKKNSFTLSLKGNAAEEADKTAASIDGLSEAIAKSEETIKNMSADLRRLRGSSAEVKAEKDKLKAAIGAERAEISRGTLEIKKLGGATSDYANKKKQLIELEKKSENASKKSTDEAKKRSASLKTAISATGGPVKDLSEKMGTLGEVTEGLGAAEGVAALGALAAVAAVAALAGGVVYAGAKLTSFIITSQAAAREMNLLRQAATGSADNAQHLGEQVDFLAKNVPIAKGEINKLGIELGRAGLRGQTIVDTMSAIEQATGVGDEALAGFAKDLVERGQQFNRFSLSPQELLGKNLRFDDVAKELADGMHMSIDEARQELLAGQVPLEQGAAALARAMKTKFGTVNKALMLDPGHQVEKFEENLKSMTTGVNIEPLLHDMSQFFELFDPDKSTSGAAIKQLVTSLGTDLVDGIHEVMPAASLMARGLVLDATLADNAWLNFKISIKKGFKEIDDAGKSLKSTLDTLGTASLPGGGGANKGVVAALPSGVRSAISDGLSVAEQAGSDLAAAASRGFTAKAEIRSPSKLFERHTGDIIRGVVDPLKRSEPQVSDALNVMMMPMMRLGAPSSASSGASAATQALSGPKELHVHFEGVNDKTRTSLESPSVRVALVKLLEEALRQGGYGVSGQPA